MENSVKKTALNATHKSLGAKMIPFAGYEMPVRYSGDKAEHLCVRERAGVFDVSHMGEFIVRGPKALELVQRVTSNNAARLVDGKAQYSCLPNHDGGIVDDLIVYRIADDQYMLVVNASNIGKRLELDPGIECLHRSRNPRHFGRNLSAGRIGPQSRCHCAEIDFHASG